MDFRPFEDKELVRKIEEERERLIAELEKYDLGSDEARFILRKISIISNKLLEKARYGK